jgi:Raf kinase inhibitor-like YbhB/YbcL family protein
MALTLSSPAFTAGASLPQLFTCDGSNIAPHLAWSGAPRDVQSFVLIMDDPDAPRGTYTHWVLFDIPGAQLDLPSGARSYAIGVSGRNSSGEIGYMGPCPPSGTHRYFFRLFALDVKSLGLIVGASRKAVEDAMAGHVLEEAELMGRYQRQPGA